eukprot:Skav214677  [mRNA]  locus=scaffold923:646910:653265:+ [translate_table: standard]
MDKNRRRLMELGAVAIMTSVVQAHAACEQVVEAVCQLLYMLAFHAEKRHGSLVGLAPVVAIAARGSATSQKWGHWLEEVCR